MQKKKKINTPSSVPVMEDPVTTEDMVNKYGTYEIQPTGDTQHEFPKISQGLPKNKNPKNSRS